MNIGFLSLATFMLVIGVAMAAFVGYMAKENYSSCDFAGKLLYNALIVVYGGFALCCIGFFYSVITGDIR